MENTNIAHNETDLANLYAEFLQSFPANLQADQFYLTYHARPESPTQFASIESQLQAFDEVIPNSAALHLLKGHIALRRNQIDAAIAAYEKAVAGEQGLLTDHGAESIFALAVAHFLKGNFHASVDLFAEYRQRKPDSENIHQFFTYLGRDKQAPAAPPQPQMQASPPPQMTPPPQFAAPTQSQPAQPAPQTPSAAAQPTITIPKVAKSRQVAVPRLPTSAPKTNAAPASDQSDKPCPDESTADSPCQKKKQKPAPKSAQADYVKGQEEGCFIATVAFGSDEAEPVRQLRAFRDVHLKRSQPGRAFIWTYYRFSPVLSRRLAHRPRLLAAIRWLLSITIKFLPKKQL